MENNTLKKYLNSGNIILSLVIITILLWITSLMNWITALTGVSKSVSDTADSVASLFGFGNNSTSEALSSVSSTMTGNLWSLYEEGEKTSTSLGLFFMILIISLIALSLLSIFKGTKAIKITTGIVGVFSSFVFMIISIGYSTIFESLNETTSSSSYGLASTTISYQIGYKLFITFSILLLLISILTIYTSVKKKKQNIY